MQVRNRQRSSARAGFTLMEILVVMAIIVVLASVGGVYYMKYLDDSKISAAKLQVKILSQQVDAYETKHGQRPASLAVLAQKEEDGSKPYVEPDALKTPWGTDYQYDAGGGNNGGSKADIWADNPKGGRIGNWSGQQ